MPRRDSLRRLLTTFNGLLILLPLLLPAASAQGVRTAAAERHHEYLWYEAENMGGLSLEIGRAHV